MQWFCNKKNGFSKKSKSSSNHTKYTIVSWVLDNVYILMAVEIRTRKSLMSIISYSQEAITVTRTKWERHSMTQCNQMFNSEDLKRVRKANISSLV